MKKRHSIYLVIFLTAPLATAQNIFEPGYIITSEQDTLRGYIEDEIDAKLSLDVNFRSGMNGDLKEYDPEELEGFGFNNGRTFRKMFYKDIKTGEKRAIFAKLVGEGKLDLLLWRKKESRAPDIFVVNNATSEQVHLRKPVKTKVTGDDGKIYNQKDQNYLGLLNYIMGDSSTIEKIRYSGKRIRKSVCSYNKKFEQNFPVGSYEEQTETYFDILGGISTIGTEGSTNFSASIFWNKVFIEKKKNLSLISGIMYRQWYDANREVPKNQSTHNVNFRDRSINPMPIGIKIHGKAGRIIPYAYAGLGFEVMVSTYHSFDNGEKIGEKNDYAIWPTLNAGAGLKWKLGPGHVLTEVASFIYGLSFNLGYSL